LVYIGIQIKAIIDFENTYRRNLWSNDVVIEPTRIEVTRYNLQVAIRFAIERDDADDFNVDRYVRTEFGQVFYEWDDVGGF
jgi:hypothetical protein